MHVKQFRSQESRLTRYNKDKLYRAHLTILRIQSEKITIDIMLYALCNTFQYLHDTI